VVLPCNDNNLCTADSFDETTLECVYTPVADGAECDDGSPAPSRITVRPACASAAAPCAMTASPGAT